MRYVTGFGQSEGPFTIQMPEMGVYETEEEAEAALQVIIDNVPTNAILERAEVIQKGGLGYQALVVYRYQSFRAYVPARGTVNYIEQSDTFTPLGAAMMGDNAGVAQDEELGLRDQQAVADEDRGLAMEERTEEKKTSPLLIGLLAVGGLALVGGVAYAATRKRRAA